MNGKNFRPHGCKKTVIVPKTWDGRRVVLHFGAVAGKFAVYVNGQRAGEGFDIFFAQDFDVTRFIRFGADNQILVRSSAQKYLTSRDIMAGANICPARFWGTFITGIWQDVFLLAEPKVAVSDIFVRPLVDQDEFVRRGDGQQSCHNPVNGGCLVPSP